MTIKKRLSIYGMFYVLEKLASSLHGILQGMDNSKATASEALIHIYVLTLEYMWYNLHDTLVCLARLQLPLDVTITRRS